MSVNFEKNANKCSTQEKPLWAPISDENDNKEHDVTKINDINKQKLLYDCHKVLSRIPENFSKKSKSKYKIPKEWLAKNNTDLNEHVNSMEKREKEDNIIKIDYDNSTTVSLNFNLNDNLKCLFEKIIKVISDYYNLKDNTGVNSGKEEQPKTETEGNENDISQFSQNKQVNKSELNDTVAQKNSSVTEDSSVNKSDSRGFKSNIVNSSITGISTKSKDLNKMKKKKPKYILEKKESNQFDRLKESAPRITNDSSYYYESSSARPNHDETYEKNSKSFRNERETSKSSSNEYSSSSSCESSSSEKKNPGNCKVLSSENLNICNSSVPQKETFVSYGNSFCEKSQVQCYQIEDFSQISHSTLNNVLDEINDVHPQFDDNNDNRFSKYLEKDEIYTLEKECLKNSCTGQEPLTRFRNRTQNKNKNPPRSFRGQRESVNNVQNIVVGKPNLCEEMFSEEEMSEFQFDGKCHPQCSKRHCIFETVRKYVQSPIDAISGQPKKRFSFLNEADNEFRNYLKKTLPINR